jgi:hypothetical protein
VTLVRFTTWALAGAMLLALGACEKGKTRHLPPDPFAPAPAPAAPEAATGAALSAGLPKRPQMAGFFLDHVGQAADPFSKRPAVTPAKEPVLLDGFGFDPIAKTPAKGVDVVIDGKAYGTKYGKARQDVAAYFKTPALVNVGFSTTLPAGTLAPGAHMAIVRVVAADGKGYYDSPAVAFEVR